MRIRIGNLNFRMRDRAEGLGIKLFSQFLVEDDESPCYEICLLDEAPAEREGRILYQDNRLLVMEGQGDLLESRIYWHPITGEKYADHNIYAEHSEVYYYNPSEEQEEWEFLHLMSLALDKIASFQHCFVLHSSSILVDGEMILFSAPSGTGKSTQADLWNKYRDALIVNGDRNLLFYRDGRFYAQGWVLSGSSEHRQNVCAPVKAIVTLEKSPVNEISRLKGKDALRRLYQEIISNHWDSKCVNAEFDFLAHFLTEVPVLFFTCTKNEDAVDVLEEYLRYLMDSQGE